MSEHSFPLGHRVIHIHDHWDAHAARWTLTLASEPNRVLVVHVPEAGLQQERALAETLAVALGHPAQIDLDRPLPVTERTLQALRPSLLGFRPADVILHRAHWLPIDTLQALPQWCAGAGSRVWITTSPPVRDEIARLICRHAHVGDTIGWAEFEEQWQGRTTVEPAATAPAAAEELHMPPACSRYPAVPESHFTQFRHRAATQLSSRQMSAVDEQLQASARYAAGALADQLDQLAGEHDASRNPQHVLLADHHARHIHHGDAAVAVTRLRGMQVGLFQRGWHLDVDLTRYLAAHAVARPVPDDHLAAALVRLLRRRDPRITAAALLCLLDVPRHHTPAIVVGDISADGRRLRQHGQWKPVPAPAHRHLAAARAARLLDGATPDDPLHIWPHHPPYPRHIREATSDVLTQLGIRTPTELLHEYVADGRHPSEPLRHLGLTLSRLPEAAVDMYAGPAPRSSGPSDQIAPTKRITPDPGHTRRLTGTDAVVLRAAVQQRPPAARRIPAVEAAQINLRAAGLISGNTATSATLFSVELQL